MLQSCGHRKGAAFLTCSAEQALKKISGQPIFYTQYKFLSILGDSSVTHEARSTLRNAHAWLLAEQSKRAFSRENLFFLAFFPNLNLLSYLILGHQKVLDVRLPEVRQCLISQFSSESGVRGRTCFTSLTHGTAAGSLLSLQTHAEKKIKNANFLFKLTLVRCLCHIASYYVHNLSMLWNLILGVVIWQSKKNLTWKKIHVFNLSFWIRIQQFYIYLLAKR